jgi:hypothetical protein
MPLTPFIAAPLFDVHRQIPEALTPDETNGLQKENVLKP